jgi:hypothetical protein
MSSVVGSVVGGIGGLMGSNRGRKNAQEAARLAQFNPFNISGAGGNVSFNGQNVNASRSQSQQQFGDAFQNQSLQNLSGGNANQGLIDFSNQLGRSGIPQLFGGAMDASQNTAQGAANLFTGNAIQNAQFGNQAGRQGLDLAQQFGTSQTGANEGVAQGLFGQGFNALGNTDFSSLAADQLSRSRQLARPGEDRAVNSKFANLFNKGALSSTGGERQIGELALAQEQADIGRQFGADQFANQLGQQNRQFGLQSIGQGLGARQQDSQFNQQAASLFGGLGQNLLGFGAQQAQSGLNAQLQQSEMGNNRAQQRLQNANDIFGFGQGAQSQNFNQALQGFGVNSQINGDLRQLIGLSGNLGNAQSQAGARAGGFLTSEANNASPFGSFLQGLGGSSSLFGGGSALAGLIGG